ncbi:MAG: enoyl-CoA hydratase/isomerase family protein [Hyphomonas sp.]|nr:enoyl-CoA hydratase/isomerase family protein [Hyphomonas sp.]
MPDTIRSDTGSGVTTVTIDRPPVNALDLGTIRELTEAFSEAAPDAPIVLTGAGNVFSAGVDTKAFAGYAPAEKADMIGAITVMTAAILSHKAPVVAAVNGHALGGGFVLMLCADVRLVAARMEARFGLTEAKAGVPFPAGPLEIIRAELAPDVLRRLTLTSETISAETLLDLGIADRAIAPVDLLALARARARDMADQPAFATVKQQVRGALIARVKHLAVTGGDPGSGTFRN